MTEQSLRLAFVYPRLLRLTGAQRLILQLASTMAAGGDRVTLVTHHLAPSCREVLDTRVRVVETRARADWTGRHLVDSTIEYATSPWLVGAVPADVDAIVFFGPPSLPALAWARARGRRRLLTFCYEPPRFAYADRWALANRFGPLAMLAALAFWLYRPVDRWLLGRADLVCANGRFGATEIARVYRRPALVLDHGVALPTVSADAVANAAERLHLGDLPMVLSVNHLHPRKRLDLFLRAIATARQAEPTLIAVLAGSGADRRRLEAIAHELGLTEWVRFTGHVSDAELAALYQRATVYLHTGRQETFGLSVLEAAAAGCPVIAVDEGGPRDILEHGGLGLLLPAEEADLARAVVALVRDDDGRRTLAERASHRVRERFRWENGAAALRRAVHQLAAGDNEVAIVATAAHGQH